MMVRGIGSLIAIILLVTGTARAQTATDSRWAAGGIGGFGRTWDDESSLGTGLLLGGRVEGRITEGLRIEGAVDWLQHKRDLGAFQADGSTTFLTAALKYRFGREEAHGYVLGGPTLALLSSTVSFEGVAQTVDSNAFGFSVGGGAAFPAGPRFEIGPEMRLLMLMSDDEAGPSFAIYGGVRIAFNR